MAKLQRDGDALFYQEAGSGDPPLVFIHGGLADRTHFSPQMETFSQAHRTIAVDLKGHGQSDKPEGEYTIAGYAEEVNWVCDQLGVRSPIIIGHSMGGLVTLELGARFADFPRAAVILDAPIVPPAFFEGAVTPFVEAVQTEGYEAAIREFFGQFVGFADNPEQRNRILDQLASVPQHVAASVLANYLAYDTAEAASAFKLPVLYVSSGPWFTEVPRFQELCPQLITAQTYGSGHYHQLEVPDQVNAILRRFIDVTTQGS